MLSQRMLSMPSLACFVCLMIAAAQTLVWQGPAAKTIDPGTNQGKTRKNLDKAIAKLLKKFPPQTK